MHYVDFAHFAHRNRGFVEGRHKNIYLNTIHNNVFNLNSIMMN